MFVEQKKAISDGGGRHRCRDLVLDSKDIGQITIVAFCPDVITGFRINKLRCDPNPVATAAHAAFHQIAHA